MILTVVNAEYKEFGALCDKDLKSRACVYPIAACLCWPEVCQWAVQITHVGMISMLTRGGSPKLHDAVLHFYGMHAGRAALMRSVQELYGSTHLADVSLVVCGRHMPAHRHVLAPHSPVFERMWQHPMSEARPLSHPQG